MNDETAANTEDLKLSPEQLVALSPEAKRAVITRWMEDLHL